MRVFSRGIFLLAFLFALPSCRAGRAQDTPAPPVPFPNASFEQGLDEWTIAPGASSFIGVTRSRASDGVHSLAIIDNDNKRGAGITGPRVALTSGGGDFAVFARVFPQTGGGVVVSVRLRDASGKTLSAGRAFVPQAVPRAPVGKWSSFRFAFRAPARAATAEIVLSTGVSARVTACLDNFVLVPLPTSKNAAPQAIKKP